jgi:hypothetical protein
MSQHKPSWRSQSSRTAENQFRLANMNVAL